MRKQQKIWKEEHDKETALPAIGFKENASSFVKSFIAYLYEHEVRPPLKAVDIGCGKGRNTIYLAKEGFEVYAMDYIPLAIKTTEALTQQASLIDKVHLFENAIDKPWQFPDNYFDIAIDCFSSIDVETKKGRETYRNEMYRTLKPGGYAMVSVVSVNDELEGEIMRQHPGKEKNSVYWPINGKFQKNYDEKELRDFYKIFKIVRLEEIKRQTFKLGKNYIASNFWLVLQKP